MSDEEKGTGGYDARTALVVVDVQNDFADPSGALFVPHGDEAIAAINREVDAARDAGATVVYTQDWHPPETPHFAGSGGTWPVHCVRDTWGAELHPRLRVVDGPVVRKGTGEADGYSAFSENLPGDAGTTTGLDGLLRERGISRVVVVGLAQDVCVKETVLDAARMRFDVAVVGDATRPVELSPGDGVRAMEEMARAGAHLR